MKRIVALFLSVLMILSLTPVVFSAGITETQISFDLTSGGEHTITVPTGTVITVDLSLSNKTDYDAPFNVESIYNDVKIDNHFFEIDDTLIESSVITNAFFQADDRRQKWARFNGYHIDPERAYSSDEVVASFKLKVKATSGQTTISSTSLSLYSDNYKSYQLTSEDLTVIVGETPPTLYNVKYMHNGAVYKTAQMAGAITVDAMPSPALQGYSFLGWECNGELYQPGDEFTVANDVTFTAKWEEVAVVVNRTLTFDTDGGTAVGTVTKPDGTNVDLTTYTTSKSGYIFDGWYEDEALTNKITAITLDGNKTVYAKWKEDIKPTYTLTFDVNGGSSLAPLTKEEGTVISLASYRPNKSGYAFDGWYSDSLFTQRITSVTLDSSKTIYAKWKQNSITPGAGVGGGGMASNYTITFKDADGTELGSTEEKADTTIDLGKYKYEKEGYVFDGWYTDKELTNKISSIKLTKAVVIYAGWVKADEAISGYPDVFIKEHYAYIIGREDNKIEPMANITRAEVAAIFFRILTEEVRSENITYTNSFVDVNEGDWFNKSISTLANMGIIKGRTTDTFDPMANITRAEFTAIAARFSDADYDGESLFYDIDGHWAENYINTAASIGWVIGENGLFRPDDSITRAEAITLINRVLKRMPEAKEDLLDGMFTASDNTDTTTWYYLAIQEATNSHDYEMKADRKHEKWTALMENPDWAE